MEDMTFYDFITFDVDFVGVQCLFSNSFHSFLKHRRNMTFMTLNGPTYKKTYAVAQFSGTRNKPQMPVTVYWKE